MKRTIFTAGALALASGLFFAPDALATHPADAPEPSAACGSTPVAQDADSLTVCVTEGPVQGSGTLQGSAGPDGVSGSAIADGDSTNSGALAGYIGIDGGGPASSGCPAPYTGEDPNDDLDAAETVEFIVGGGQSDCDAGGHPAP